MVLVFVGGGCADHGSGASAADGTAPADQADVAVLERYVSALAGGDVDTAMERRCRESRIAPSEREEFERQLRRLIEAEGELGLARVEVGDRDPPVVSSLRNRDAVLLHYWLSFDGDDVDEPLVAIVADQDGERRLCTQVTPAYLEVIGELREGVGDLGAPSTASLADLMPQAVGPDPRLVLDEAVHPSRVAEPLVGAQEGWVRIWQNADGVVTVGAYRYASPADARGAARAFLAEQAKAVIETFDISDIPGAQGIRLLSAAWLWVQPPTVGPYRDEITIVFGDTVVIAGVNSTSPDGDRQAALTQAREVVRLANGSG